MSIGMILLYVLGFIALVIVCSLGFIARLRERAVDRAREAERQRRIDRPGPPDPPTGS